MSGLLPGGDVRLDAGGSTSGLAHYVYECFGDESWDPRIVNGRIRTRVQVSDVFGHRAACLIDCQEKSLEEIEKMVPDISSIR